MMACEPEEGRLSMASYDRSSKLCLLCNPNKWGVNDDKMACEPKGRVGTMPTDNGLEAMSALLPENAGSHKKKHRQLHGCQPEDQKRVGLGLYSTA